MSETYDVFISYARTDGERVRPVVQALREHGLLVWFDETEVTTFASISQRISQGLLNAKALLAFYSNAYPTRRSCQWELTAAFLAAQREGDPRRRVWVINLETDATHIHPVELRDALFRSLPTPGDDGAFAATATAVRQAIAGLSTVFTGPLPIVQPRWYGGKGLGSNRFVGRVRAFWKIHTFLFAGDLPAISARAAPGYAQIQAMGGMGKSLLAEEYALRFGAAYPGGVFMLRGTGDRDDQISDFAARLGLDVKNLTVPRIEGWLQATLHDRGQAYLWLVDDLPRDMSEDERRRWFAPEGLGKTLVTTRSRGYGAGSGGVIDLEGLDAQDGYDLLTMRRKPESVQEERAATEIVEELGGHALAIDLSGGALFKLGGRESFAGFLAKIRAPKPDALSAAAELRPDLPNGHELSIANTLLTSIDFLDEDGRDFLRLASTLASEVVPYELVDRVFKLSGTSSQWGAAALVESVTMNCLAEESEGSDGLRGYVVHSLVARTVRLYDNKPERQSLFRERAVRALEDILPGVLDARKHRELRAHVAHARHLGGSLEGVDEAILLAWVARYEYERGSYSSAQKHWGAVLDGMQRLSGNEDSDTLAARLNLAQTLLAQGDLRGARNHQETVLEARSRLLGDEHADTLTARNNLAQTLFAQGAFCQARSHQEAVLATSIRVLGVEHPHTLTAKSNLAQTLCAQGSLHEARGLLEAVFESRRRTQGAEHGDTLMARHNLATTLRAQGDLDGAREHQEGVLKDMVALFGDQHPDTLAARGGLGVTLYDQDDLPGARECLEGVLEAMQRLLGDEHPDTLTTRNNFAMTLFAQGDYVCARGHQEAVLEARRRVLGADHPATLAAGSNLARTLRAQGKVCLTSSVASDFGGKPSKR